MTEWEEKERYALMKKIIEKKRLNYDEIKDDYISGMGEDKIAWKHRLTMEQLKWVFKNILQISRREQKVRDDIREKFESIRTPFELPDDRPPIYPNQGIPKDKEEKEYEL